MLLNNNLTHAEILSWLILEKENTIINDVFLQLSNFDMFFFFCSIMNNTPARCLI